jgi:hypothetical protein
MAGEVRVVVYDSRIQAMSAPGGMVFKYANEKARRAAAFGKEMAPKRTMRMANSIRHDTRTVRNGAVGRVRVTVPYARYVIKGTDGPIFPDGEFLWVPVAPRAVKRRRMPSVSGQSANNFMERALAASMATPYLSRSPRITGNPFG